MPRHRRRQPSTDMKRLLALPLFWKLLAPAGLSILCLLAYLAFSTSVFKQNNQRLQAVRDVHFPVLDAMTRNVAALDDVINGLNVATTRASPCMTRSPMTWSIDL